jgi:hypothetical protein
VRLLELKTKEETFVGIKKKETPITQDKSTPTITHATHAMSP